MPLLQSKLKDIESDDVLQIVADLCNMAQWPVAEFEQHSLHAFLQLAMTRPPKLLTLDYVALPSALGTRMDKLQRHGFYAVCSELQQGGSLEPFDRVSLLSYLKKRFARHRPAKPRKPTKADRWDAVVQQRRANRR